MSERLTNILGYLTLFAILAAIWIMFGEDPSKDQGARGGRVFTGFEDEVNQINLIKLSSGDKETVLRLSGGRWLIENKDNYGANADKVRAFLKGVALSDRREPKTANKSRYTRIGLGDQGMNVDLFSSSENNSLSFQIGKRKANAVTGRSLTYISQDTDTRAWLVTAIAEASADPVWWIDKTIHKFDQKRIARAEINGITIERKKDATDFSLAQLGAGEKPAAAWKLAEPVRVLSNVQVQDVLKLNNPLSNPVSTGWIDTSDGLQYSYQLFEMNNESWVRFEVTLNDRKAVVEADKDINSPVVAEATNLSRLVSGWLFKISEADAAILKFSKNDFLLPQENPITK